MTVQVTYALAAKLFRSLAGGLFGLLLATAVAGPSLAGVHEPAKGDRVAMDSVTDESTAGDDPFHAMFVGWKRQDTVAQPSISVPSVKPINMATFTSGFGVRSDPFRGSAAMHAGIDLAAPSGTAVYATADGTIDRAEWFGGYGNCVEINHGKGVATRFGHLSRILVHPGQRVHRGDLIALVGSTGRSTGAHLHYEVRIDGHAVNPVPFLQASDYVVAMHQRSSQIAIGGPEDDID